MDVNTMRIPSYIIDSRTSTVVAVDYHNNKSWSSYDDVKQYYHMRREDL